MSNILHIAIKDVKLLTRDPMAMFFMLGFPILLGVLFGFMYQGVGKPQAGSLAVAVVDQDQSEFSELFIENLKKQDSLKVLSLSEDEARKKIKNREIVGFVVIPPDFGKTAGIFWAENPPTIRLGRDPSRLAEAAMLEGFLMEASGQLIGNRFQDTTAARSLLQEQAEALQQTDDVAPLTKLLVGQLYRNLDQVFDSIDQVNENANDAGDGADAQTPEDGANRPGTGPGFKIAKIETFDAFQKSTRGGSLPVRSGWDLSFPAGILWGVMGSAAGFAISLVRERSRGTLLRLQTSPATTWQIILGKGLGCFMATLTVIGLMVALGLFLGMRPTSPLLLVASSVLVAFAFVGIMMTMSALGKTEEAVGGAGWAMNTVMAMFGGAMMPLAFMPGFMQTWSHASPVKWSILALEGAIWRNYSIVDMILPWTILIVIGSLGFALGMQLYCRNIRL
jgi:ABC-2 type transport system permease protein